MKKTGFILFLFFIMLKLTGQPYCEIQIHSRDTAICYGEKVWLYTAFSDTLNYYWEPGGETNVIIGVTVIEPVTCILHTFNHDSSFYCIDSLRLSPLPYPELRIHYSPEPIPILTPINFNFECISGDPGLLTYWEWDIYDTVFTNVSNPVYVFQEAGSYFIRLKYLTTDGCWFYIQEYIEASYASIDEPVLHDFSIFPNPADGHLTFSFFLKDHATVELSIYNSIGEVVRIIIPYSNLCGQQNVTWDAGETPPGLYFAQLIIDNKSYTSKIVMR